MGVMPTRRFRLTRTHASLAQARAIYPFLAGGGIGTPGVLIGVDHLAGGAPFAFDPFDAYAAELVTNPNMLVAGEPGTGKSATVKALLARTTNVRGRWAAICDPKGEYAPVADELGYTTIRLAPGGTMRINPLDAGPASHDIGPMETARRQSAMVTALIGAILGRDLLPLEDAVVGWALTHLAAHTTNPTLADLARVIAEPDATMGAAAGRTTTELAREVESVRFALGKLLDRNLRGMFDGRTTGRIDWNANGVVVDLSAVHGDTDALRAVLVATTGWLNAALAGHNGPRRLLVLDEAWAVLADARTARFLQASFKLGRANGVANLAVVHRLSDLRAQADDGTSTNKVAAGLLADAATRVVFRQAADQATEARSLLGLTAPEGDLIGRLTRGRALWKIGSHTAVVATHLARSERDVFDTDRRMRG